MFLLAGLVSASSHTLSVMHISQTNNEKERDKTSRFGLYLFETRTVTQRDIYESIISAKPNVLPSHVSTLNKVLQWKQ